jgi:hypothetical protein
MSNIGNQPNQFKKAPQPNTRRAPNAKAKNPSNPPVKPPVKPPLLADADIMICGPKGGILENLDLHG